ncbi:MAG TPA: VWA domain-containing protein [Pyrinomonadaceae bacterium]|nr:VWA domain-containing protein [Pyrinomonadaceae bacterium]
MKKSVFCLCLLVILTATSVFAQSGRRRTVEPAGTSTKTSDQQSTNNDSNEGISASKTGPEGETVEGDVLRVDTSLVTVPVSVVDRNGKYVGDLKRQDFRIFEEGVEQKIAYFATVDQPFTVVLLLDTSGSTEFRLEDIQEAAITFVNQLKSNDSVMVISFDDRIDVLIRPSTDRDAIIRAIRSSRTGGGTRLYDTVDTVLRKYLRTINGRKAVVLFTDGVDTTSHSATFESTLREAEESDAPIYSVGYNTSLLGGMGQGLPLPGNRGPVIFGIPIPRPNTRGGIPGTNPGDYRRANIYLRALADKTGARYYNADSLVGIGDAFRQVAEELGRQYSLGYYPKTAAQAGQRRQIKVRVNQPDLAVKARDSYIYSDKKAARDQSKQSQPFVRQRTASTSDGPQPLKVEPRR